MLDLSTVELMLRNSNEAVSFIEKKAEAIRAEAIDRLAKEFTQKIVPACRYIQSLCELAGVRMRVQFDNLKIQHINMKIAYGQSFLIVITDDGSIECALQANEKDCARFLNGINQCELMVIAELIHHWDDVYEPLIEDNIRKNLIAEIERRQKEADCKLYEALELKGV